MGTKKNIAVGALIAGAAGYVAGVLTAPKSGRETRKDIRKKALHAKKEAEQKLKEVHSELSKLMDEATSKVKTGKEKVGQEFHDAMSRADAARKKAKDLLSAVHEGEAEDKDLNKALEDAKQALTHLKKYIGKKADQK